MMLSNKDVVQSTLAFTQTCTGNSRVRERRAAEMGGSAVWEQSAATARNI